MSLNGLFKKAAIATSIATQAVAGYGHTGAPQPNAFVAPVVVSTTAVNSSAPRYDPNEWTDDALGKVSPLITTLTKTHNDYEIPVANCYAYATQAPNLQRPGTTLGTDARFLLPAEGKPLSFDAQDTKQRAQHYIAGATVDGLEFIGQEAKRKPGTYLIAYYQLTPDKNCIAGDCATDYHYVRQDNDGGWSHKPGMTDIRRTDSTGAVIRDPSKADIRAGNQRYDFVGYFLAPEGGLAPQNKFLPNSGFNALQSYQGGALQEGQTLIARLNYENGYGTLFLQRDDKGGWAQINHSITNQKDDLGQAIQDPKKAHFEGFKFQEYLVAPNGKNAQFEITRIPNLTTGRAKFSNSFPTP